MKINSYQFQLQLTTKVMKIIAKRTITDLAQSIYDNYEKFNEKENYALVILS